MQRIALSAVFCLLTASLAHAGEQLERHFAMFPNAVTAPPIPVAGADGALFIPGWAEADHADVFYQPDDGATAGFLQITRENNGYTIDSFFDELIAAAGLTDVDRPMGMEAEAFKTVFGPMVAAVFGAGQRDGTSVTFFADLHVDGRVLGTLIYATTDEFNRWDGVLLPLVRNGYVKDPGIFENRAVMRAGTKAQWTEFYVGMVNTKIMSEANAFAAISAGAMQAASNASTIASCAGASNCSVSYDGAGNAVADFDYGITD